MPQGANNCTEVQFTTQDSNFASLSTSRQHTIWNHPPLHAQPWSQLDTVAVKIWSLLVFIRKALKWFITIVTLLVYSTLTRPTIDYCIQAWSTTNVRDIDVVKSMSELATWNNPRYIPFTPAERVCRLMLCMLRLRWHQQHCLHRHRWVLRLLNASKSLRVFLYPHQAAYAHKYPPTYICCNID